MQPILTIEQLTIRFKGSAQPAVENLSLAIHPAEVLAIVGESGSGKSVSSLAILGLLPKPAVGQLEGKIWFSSGENQQVDMLSLAEKELKHLRGNRIAMIFQEPMTSLNPVLTCGEQVMEAILAHQPISAEEARQQTIRLFERVKLPDPERLLKKYPHQLSGGQKQRVMIAMAISGNPALLICDEPTTALDVTVQKEILALLRELQQETGMAMIFISHDLSLVSEIADRIAVMYRGKLLELNDSRILLSHPAHAYTKALIACRPATANRGVRLPVVSDFVEWKEGHLVEKKMIRQPVITTAAHMTEPVSSDEILQVEKLNVWYPISTSWTGHVRQYLKAVNDVTFSIVRGETLGLVGESGCGKSTLGRAILRLAPVTSGIIEFEGKNLTALPEKAMRALRGRMQLIFQDPYSSLSPRLRIGDAMDEVLKTHTPLNARQRKDRSIELLQKVSLLPDHYNRYPHEFSGGQRQRIVIARALAANPSFIVCDESVSALDVSVQAQVLNLLSDLKHEFGFTALFISHDLAVVRYFCDRVMVMQAGEIVETGSATTIYENPRHPYTQKLLAAVPGMGRI